MDPSNNNVNVDIGLGETLSKTYDDLIHPVAQPIGEVVSLVPRTIKVLTIPWNNWVQKREGLLQDIATDAAKINAAKGLSEDDIVEPEDHIIVPALQAIAYSMDAEEIKNMFSRLLASATDKNMKDSVHPSFVELIKNMSQTDAKLLKYCYDTGIPALCGAEIRFQELEDEKILKSSIFSKLSTNGVIIHNSIINHPFDINLNELNISLDNLIRLNLMERNKDSHYTKPEYQKYYWDLYLNQEFINTYYKYKDSLQNYDVKYEYTLIMQTLKITSYGNSFCRICL